MIKVGLTGGIGSGKSTVAKEFMKLGIPVFDSDANAKSHYKKQIVKDRLVGLFGKDILTKDNEVDKKYLAGKIFNNTTYMYMVTQIIHQYVIADFCFKFYEENKKAPYCLFESALIFEYDLMHMFKSIIKVDANFSVRIERVMKRNNMTYEEVTERVFSQREFDINHQRLFLSNKNNFKITNNHSDNIEDQVLLIHNTLTGNGK